MKDFGISDSEMFEYYTFPVKDKSVL